MADLEAAGMIVRELAKTRFPEGVLLQRGVVLCVASEEVAVYTFATPEERAEVTAQIDRDDPTRVGEAIIEWAGNPRFWERDRIVVLYVGSDEATERQLSSILGLPFARGTTGSPVPVDDRC